jgi:hypothetical protein
MRAICVRCGTPKANVFHRCMECDPQIIEVPEGDPPAVILEELERSANPGSKLRPRLRSKAPVTLRN